MKIDTNALIMAQVLGGGGSSVTVEPLSVTANGEYTAPTGKAYSPVTVNVAKPDYLISDGDTVSTFYFNTAYALGTWLATLTYSDLDPDTGLYVCYTGLGYFFGVDLTSGQYALVWNDGVNIVPIYSTVAVPSFGVTEAGWQVASYTPSVATTVVWEQIIPALSGVLDDVVAKDDIAFGIELPQLNAPTISLSQSSATAYVTITNPSTNGNFVTGYGVYADGVKLGDTQTTSYTITGTQSGYSSITARAYAAGFSDSADSNSATYYNYYDVTMYDDDGTTVLTTASVKYGEMPTYVPVKSGYAFMYWVDSNGTEVTAITSDTNLYAYYIEATSKFVVTGTNLSVTVTEKKWDGTLEYSTDSGSTWSTADTATVISGNEIWLRGTGNTKVGAYSATPKNYFTWSGTNISCSGDLEALLDYGTAGAGNHPTYGTYAFAFLFCNCTGLVGAPTLPSYSYVGIFYGMFYGCTGLTSAPAIPNITPSRFGYSNMFRGCTGLTSAPSLPATTLDASCYLSMFQGCTGLTSAPSLPATTLASSCYESMFQGCTGLTAMPNLQATTLALGCYRSMFYGCTSLTTVYTLPATTLEEGCYSSMFNRCSALTVPPSISATTYAKQSCQSMFYNCTSLTKLNSLKGTDFSASQVFDSMYNGCTSIKVYTSSATGHTRAWSIPQTGVGTPSGTYFSNMLANTGGGFTGSPQINIGYYTENYPV